MIVYMFNAVLPNLPTLSLSLSHRVHKTVLDISVSFAVSYTGLFITIFLNSIYMLYYTVLVFFLLAYFTLYYRLQFHIVQISHAYMTPGKTIALTRQTFVGKVMSLLFNMLHNYDFIIVTASLDFSDGPVIRIRLPMKEMWVRSLGWEDPPKKKMATHSSIFAWEIPWTEEPGMGYA